LTDKQRQKLSNSMAEVEERSWRRDAC